MKPNEGHKFPKPGHCIYGFDYWDLMNWKRDFDSFLDEVASQEDLPTVTDTIWNKAQQTLVKMIKEKFLKCEK